MNIMKSILTFDILFAPLLLFLTVHELSFGLPNCSLYDIDVNVISVKASKPEPNSAIAKVFASLEGELNATLMEERSGQPPCYEWTCQSMERKGERCRWCLPSIFVGGFAKCGTTALCDILVSHPDVRFYRKKETDIFTKMHFSIAEFERKVNTDKDTINSTLSRQGHVWLDCSAGAFRDFNAAAHLQRYSPDTKVIMMVRDPWQNIGSRIAQQARYGRRPSRKEREIKLHLKRHQYPPKERFSPTAVQRLAKHSDYVFAEKLLHWKYTLHSPHNLLVLDQHNLQHHPEEVMGRIERFLALRPFHYSPQVLHEVSHNANTAGNNLSSRTINEIHRPYSFSDEQFLRLSRNVLNPSLCLFEKIFGWKIRLITPSEVP